MKLSSVLAQRKMIGVVKNLRQFSREISSAARVHILHQLFFLFLSRKKHRKTHDENPMLTEDTTNTIQRPILSRHARDGWYLIIIITSTQITCETNIEVVNDGTIGNNYFERGKNCYFFK